MSNLTDLLPSGAGGKQVSFTATGAISSGQAVGLNSDGTVSIIATQTGVTEVESGAVYQGLGAVYDPVNDKVIVFFQDVDDSNNSKAVVGTVSGTSITFGSPELFDTTASANYFVGSYDAASGGILVVYGTGASPAKLRARLATISGTSISFGSTATHGSSNVAGHSFISISYDTNRQRHLLFFADALNSNYPTAVPITVSGTSPSFGTNVVAESNAAEHLVTCFNPSTYYHMTVRAMGENGGTIQMFDINGSGSITSGSTTSLTSNHIDEIGISYDTASGYHLIVFEDRGQNEYLYGRLATSSGSTPSLLGSETLIVGIGAYSSPNVVYNPDNGTNKVITSVQGTDFADLHEVTVTVSGTDISVGTVSNFYAGDGDGGYLYHNSLVYVTSTDQYAAFARNMTDNSLDAIVFGASGTAAPSAFTGIADAAISNGASGKVTLKGGIVTNSSLVPATYTGSVGSEVAFESARADSSFPIYDSSNNKVVVVYADDGDSGNGKAVVGTISGTSVSFGTPVTFNGATTTNISGAFDSNSNKVVINYVDSDGNRLKSIVGTVSGTSISFGSEEIVSGFVTTGTYCSTTFDSNSNKIVLFYRDDSNSEYGTAAVGTVSGTSISFGTPVIFESASTGLVQSSACFDSTNNKTVVAYRDLGNSGYGTAIVGTVSGTSISFGTAAAFHEAQTEEPKSTFDSGNGKVVVAYRDNAAPKEFASNVGTVSGTSITFGSKATVETLASYSSYSGIAFSSTDGAVVVTYQDAGNSSYGEYAIGVVSGTSITYSTPATFTTATTEDTNVVYDASTNKFLITYKDADNSNYGTGAVLTLSGGSVLTVGSTYYLQDDGSISTTSSSVTLGKAITTTSINLEYNS